VVAVISAETALKVRFSAKVRSACSLEAVAAGSMRLDTEAKGAGSGVGLFN
jgi:hypothetical protein